jgi:hypothetical protein
VKISVLIFGLSVLAFWFGAHWYSKEEPVCVHVKMAVDEWKRNLFETGVFVGTWDRPIGHFGYSDHYLPLKSAAADSLYRIEVPGELFKLALSLLANERLTARYLLQVCALRMEVAVTHDDLTESLIERLENTDILDMGRKPLPALSLSERMDRVGLRPSQIWRDPRNLSVRRKHLNH